MCLFLRACTQLRIVPGLFFFVFALCITKKKWSFRCSVHVTSFSSERCWSHRYFFNKHTREREHLCVGACYCWFGRYTTHAYNICTLQEIGRIKSECKRIRRKKATIQIFCRIQFLWAIVKWTNTGAHPLTQNTLLEWIFRRCCACLLGMFAIWGGIHDRLTARRMRRSEKNWNVEAICLPAYIDCMHSVGEKSLWSLRWTYTITNLNQNDRTR